MNNCGERLKGLRVFEWLGGAGWRVGYALLVQLSLYV